MGGGGAAECCADVMCQCLHTLQRNPAALPVPCLALRLIKQGAVEAPLDPEPLITLFDEML